MKNKFKCGERVVVADNCPNFAGDTGRIVQKIKVSYNDTNYPFKYKNKQFDLREPVYLVALDNPVKFMNGALETLVTFGQSGLNKILPQNSIT